MLVGIHQIAFVIALPEGTGLQRPFAFVIAAHRELLDALAVDANVDLARMLRAEDIGIAVPLQADAQRIFGVERKMMANRHAAARSQGKILAHAVVLDEELREFIRLRDRPRRAIPNSDAADLARGREVALQQHRRDREHVADIVEAVAGIIGGKQRGEVHRAGVHRDQVADGVGIFGAVEAMDGRPAGIELGCGGAIERRLQIGDHGFVGGLVGPRHALRRHRPHAQLANDLFEHRGVRAGVLDIGLVELQARCLQPFIVATDAVGIDNLTVVRREARIGGDGFAAAEAGPDGDGLAACK